MNTLDYFLVAVAVISSIGCLHFRDKYNELEKRHDNILNELHRAKLYADKLREELIEKDKP